MSPLRHRQVRRADAFPRGAGGHAEHALGIAEPRGQKVPLRQSPAHAALSRGGGALHRWGGRPSQPDGLETVRSRCLIALSIRASWYWQ